MTSGGRSSFDRLLKREDGGRRGSSKVVVGSLQGQSVGLAGTGAGSSISCRCELLVAAKSVTADARRPEGCGYGRQAQ